MTIHQPQPAVLAAKQVAQLLGWRCVESFYNNRKKLRDAGFPEKLPGVNGWSRNAVLRWIDGNGETSEAPIEIAPDRANALEGRYAI